MLPLELRWGQVDFRAGVVRLTPQGTKGGESRIVYLTARVQAGVR
jgi:integrase